MKRNTFGLFLCVAIAAALPQAQAQYAGRLPADHGAGADAMAANANTDSSVAVGVMTPTGTMPSKLFNTPKPIIAGPNGFEKSHVFNANSGIFRKQGSSEFNAQPKALSSSTGMTPPPGSKKGHWVQPAMYSMSAMPSWVEDK